MPGFALRYTYIEEDIPITAVTYFLFDGAYEYQVTALATTQDWDTMTGPLETAVKSLTVR